MLESPNLNKINIPLAKPFYDIFEPSLRFIFYVSGRASGKSWGVADAFIVAAMESPLSFLMTREIQKSLERSSYRLLSNRIKYFGLEKDSLFSIRRDGIRCANGSEFAFAGLQGHTVDSIKSYEAFDYCFVEEAQSISKFSNGILVPTIRKEVPANQHKSGELFRSKVVYAMNPRFESDAIYQEVLHYEQFPDPLVRVHRLSWLTNDFLPRTSFEDAKRLMERDPEEFEHVYGGGLLVFSKAAVYNNWEVGEPEVPSNAKVIMGADWGFSQDPTALVKAWYWKDNIYVTDEAYGHKVENDELPALFAGNDYIRPNDPRWENPKGYMGVPGAMSHDIIADNARPETINHVNKFGFQVKAAKKGKNSVTDGIQFIRAHKIWVHPNCTNTIRELTMYKHKVDKDDPDIVLPGIEDKHNHCMDALRYACEPLRKPTKKRSKRNIATTIVDYMKR